MPDVSRSAWFVLLGPSSKARETHEERERRAYRSALESMHDSEHDMAFQPTEREKVRANKRGAEIYDEILQQYGLGEVASSPKDTTSSSSSSREQPSTKEEKEEDTVATQPPRCLPSLLDDDDDDEARKNAPPSTVRSQSETTSVQPKQWKESLPEALHDAKVSVSRRFTPEKGQTSDHPEAFWERIQKTLATYGMAVTTKQLVTYRQIFVHVLEATDSPVAADENAVLRRAEFEAYVWARLQDRYDDEDRSVLLGPWRMKLVAEWDEASTSLLFLESRRTLSEEDSEDDDDDDEDVDEVVVHSTRRRTLVHAARLRPDETSELSPTLRGGHRRRESLTVSRKTRKTKKPCKTGEQRARFAQGGRVMVQSSGKVFTHLWRWLERELPASPLHDDDGIPVLEVSNSGKSLPPADDCCPGSEIMSFCGFCALQYRFCGGDENHQQLLMGLMSPEAFIDQSAWLDDLLDNTLLRDLHPPPCAFCHVTKRPAPPPCCCYPASSASFTSANKLTNS